MWSFLYSVELSDLIECVNARREATVEAENLILDHSCQGQVIEEFCELFPDVCIAVLSQALIIKSIPIQRNITRLMIMSLRYRNN